MLELKPSWLTRAGDIKSTDQWLKKYIEHAHFPLGLSVLDIDCSDAPDEPKPEKLYRRHHHQQRFPRVYRVKDMRWYTPLSRQPRALLLIAYPREDLHYAMASVIFRQDGSSGLVCAHAYGVAVTRPLLDFAEKKLRMLEELVAAAFERQALADKEIKKLRAIVKKGPNHPQYQEMIRLGKIGRM